MKKEFDVITVGSGVVDAFLETDLNELKHSICMPVGTKLLVKRFWLATGGGGTNAAVSFSRMGLKTAFLGKLGKDENSKIILDELKNEKVEFLGVRGRDVTGYSVVIDSNLHNRTILTFKGANENFSFDELHLGKLKTRWFYFSAMVGRALKMQEKLSHWAKKKGIKIAYNPSSYLTKTRSRRMLSILRDTDILILNDSEARDLIGKGDLFHGLKELGPKIVCITYGEKGNKIFYEGSVFLSRPNKIEVVERTGAGDAFASGFVSGWIRTGDIQTSMKIGAFNAESVIQKPGAKNGLLTWKEAASKLTRDGIKIRKR